MYSYLNEPVISNQQSVLAFVMVRVRVRSRANSIQVTVMDRVVPDLPPAIKGQMPVASLRWVSPLYFFLKKTGDLFLVITVSASSAVSPLFIFS